MFKNLFPFYQKEQQLKILILRRVKKIIIESAEQSNRISVPKITILETLKKFISSFPKKGCLVFCDINCDQK